LGNRNVGWKHCMLLLAALYACEVTAQAQTLLMWDAPLTSPVRVDGYRVYEDGSLLGEAAAASLSWPINLTDGQGHTFGVSSIHRDDVTNAVAESTATTLMFVPSPSQLSDTVPPVVAVSVRQNGGSTNYQATATATDDVALQRIELSLDGTRFATCYASPCSSTVFIKSRGSHAISAVAWDAAGNNSAATASVQR
jgi:hypothetical protein